MAATEADILRDEQERSHLMGAIADVATAIATSAPATRRILENTFENAMKRVATLDKRIEIAKVEYAAQVQTQVAAAAALAANETRLSADERDTYRSFLEKPYFTRKDFGKLDEFYTSSYDRLSEGGKEEMSKRIDEGIRRGEFKAAELPESVRKRNAGLSRDHDAVGIAEPNGHVSSAVKQTHAQEGASTMNTGERVAADSAPLSNPRIDLGSIDLTGVQLVTATSEPTAASIPDASGKGARGLS